MNAPSYFTRRLAGHPATPLAILFGLNAVDELDRSAFGVLAPQIRDEFGASLTTITALIGIVGALVVLGGLYVGYAADRYSRVRLTLGAAALWSVFCVGTGLAPGLIVLACFRVGEGVAKAVNEPTHKSLLADYYPPEGRAWAYYAHSSANSVGTCLAPLLAGGLAHVWGWRAPFLLFAIPTVVLVVVGMSRLREPVRGAHERAAAGASAELALVEEEPPSFAEAWRAIHAVTSMRRSLHALPLIAVAFVGLAGLVSLLLDERYGVSPLGLGLVFSVGAFFQVIAFELFGRATTKYVMTEPAKIYTLVGVAAPVTAMSFIVIGLAPNLITTVVALTVLQVSITPLIAGPATVLSLVMPPRARATGFAIGALYFLPGFVLYIFIGALADSRGFTFAFVAMCPFLLCGMAMLLRAGRTVRADMHAVWAAALAQSEAIAGRAAGAAKSLVVRGVDVSYGATQVLFGVDLEIGEGEIVALLGTNGAGKSTLLNAITGLAQPSAGTILFDGRDITSLPANEAAALGIVMVPGGKGVFPTMTVAENFRLAGWLFDKNPARLEASLQEVLEFFPVLRDRWDEKAGNLSGGEQQMLTLGQAFIARPRLLLIDELSLGLAPVVVERLLGIVRAIHAQGTTVVVVEQSVNVAITLAERAVFMEKGEIRFDGPTAELLERPDVLRAVFLQGAADPAGPRRAAKRASRVGNRVEAVAVDESPAAPVLEVRDLSVAFGGVQAVHRVSFEVGADEIVGLIGPNGAGKTTILDLVSGYLRPTAGSVRMRGEDITHLSPDRRAVRGLGRSFQDARLWPSLTVTQAIAVSLERHVATRDALAAALVSPATFKSEANIRARVDELVDLMNLGAYAGKFISELSTGTRRVVDLACCVGHRPQLLLLDEPSSGIAQRETEALGPILLDIRAATGAAIVVIEHDMPLIQAVSDRLVALEAGCVVATGAPADVISHPRVVEAYLGGTQAVIERSSVKAGR